MKAYIEAQVDNNFRNHPIIIAMCREGVDFAMEKLKDEKIENVLDVGCGDGYALERFKELGIKGLKGVDALEDRIETTKAKGFDAVCADFYEYEDTDNFYDLIFCSHTLEHFPHWEQAINKMLRFIKKGGHLFLIVPTLGDIPQSQAHFSFFEDGRIIAEFLETCGMEILSNFHHRRSDPEVWILAKKL
jgi:2-polyprenyl-3-methyl-5-hydroxy-6-metoxy-1,4-benzoquinol methylase